MASDILSCLEMDKKPDYSRVIVVKEINGCDSSFIVSCVLSHGIKNGHAVLVVLFHNSLSHYRNVGLKMNYNVQKCMDSGLLHFFNMGDECVQAVLLNNQCSIQTILQKLKEKIILIQNFERFIIVFDGISHLFDLQYTLKETNLFCAEIIKFLRAYKNSLVIFHCNVASEDDFTNNLANLLSHKSHIVAEVGSLSSGWSSDVSGQLTMNYPGRKFDEEHRNTIDLKTFHYLFKLFDRGVKIFAPGTI